MKKEIKERFEKVENRVSKIEKFINSGVSKNGKLIRCPKCKNSWITRSKKVTVSCTSCGQKVNVEGNLVKKKNPLYVKGKSWGEKAEEVGVFD